MPVIPAQLFYKNRDYGVGSIQFDLVLGETHNMSNIITEYKIEDGSTISDHIQNNVRTGTVTGLITNFSIGEGTLTENRALLAFQRLEELFEAKELVTIVTVYKVYEDVVIENISIAKDSNTGESIVADFSFREITKVSLQTINIEAEIKIDGMNTDINKQSSVELDAGKNLGDTSTNISDLF